MSREVLCLVKGEMAPGENVIPGLCRQKDFGNLVECTYLLNLNLSETQKPSGFSVIS